MRLASAEGCAPGWSKEVYNFDLCSTFNQCVSEFSVNVSRWERLKAIPGTDGNSRWTLPVGWNEIETAKAMFKKDNIDGITRSLLTRKLCWAMFNVPLAAIAFGGTLLMTIGLIAAFVDKEGPKLEPFSKEMLEPLD
jgi:hypothetical protein